MKNKSHSLVGVIMGSKSDWKTMIHCCDTLKKFSVKHEVKIISAHRTPNRLHKFLNEAKKNKIEVIIAGAGGAAHLAGVAASITTLPVLGVPIESKLKGLDSLLSTVQMPSGIPVATVAINAAKNAGILAAQIIGSSDEDISQSISDFKDNLARKVGEDNELLQKEL